MAVKVKNLNGTSDNKAPAEYSSWLEFWEKKAGKKAGECGHCTADAEVGAHVQKADSSDKSWYIVPLCKTCNKKSSSEEFTVYEPLVAVNK